MSKCTDCRYYPWKSTADPGMMPPMKCHPKRAARRWTKKSASKEINCPYYGVSQAVTEISVNDKSDFDVAKASYPELTEKAKQLGIAFVGKKKEVLAGEIDAVLKAGDHNDTNARAEDSS